MGSKRARLPQIAAGRRMLGHQGICYFNTLSLSRTLQSRFDAAWAQPGEHLGGDFAKHLLRELARQPLHEGIEELVAEFRVIHDNALRRSVNDFPIKVNRL